MLVLIAAGVLVMFFLTTFSKQWGGAVGKKYLDEATPKVKALKDNYPQAMRACPSIIKKLNAGIPELEKQGNTVDVLKSNKLIYDCQFATKQYADAVKTIAKLIQADPQSARLHGLNAETLNKDKKYVESLRAAHLASQLQPENYKWPHLEAKNLVELKLYKKAEKAYKKAIKLAPIDKARELVAEYEQVQIMQKEDLISDALTKKEATFEKSLGK